MRVSACGGSAERGSLLVVTLKESEIPVCFLGWRLDSRHERGSVLAVSRGKRVFVTSISLGGSMRLGVGWRNPSSPGSVCVRSPGRVIVSGSSEGEARFPSWLGARLSSRGGMCDLALRLSLHVSKQGVCGRAGKRVILAVIREAM